MANKIKLELKDKPLAPIKRPQYFFITPKLLVFLIFVIFVGFVGWYFWREISYLTKAPALEVTQPFADIVTMEERFEVAGKTDPSAILSINDEKIFLDKDGNFKFELHLAQGINIIKIEAKNRFGKINPIIRRIIFNEPEPVISEQGPTNNEQGTETSEQGTVDSEE